MTSDAAPASDLWIANTVTDLVNGDVREHLPLERIPLRGDVLGLGTTTSIDNGELTFLHDAPEGDTTIWKCQANTGGIRALQSGDGSAHFPYVCFSNDASALRTEVKLSQLGCTTGRGLQELIGEAIALLRCQGQLTDAPVYGIRLVAHWRSLIITVASKLCMGQQRRNAGITSDSSSDANDGRSIYDRLQHYRLAMTDPGNPEDPIRYLGSALRWECCGFWDSEPCTGRVTVPHPDAHLHLHGCSTDLRFGGHLHHEHPQSELLELETLFLYPLHHIHQLASDLAIEDLRCDAGNTSFRVCNRGSMDVSDVGVAIVIDNSYNTHRYLRLPWLSAGESECFSLPLPDLSPGTHQLEVIADPERHILESQELQGNNRMAITVMIEA